MQHAENKSMILLGSRCTVSQIIHNKKDRREAGRGGLGIVVATGAQHRVIKYENAVPTSENSSASHFRTALPHSTGKRWGISQFLGHILSEGSCVVCYSLVISDKGMCSLGGCHNSMAKKFASDLFCQHASDTCTAVCLAPHLPLPATALRHQLLVSVDATGAAGAYSVGCYDQHKDGYCTEQSPSCKARGSQALPTSWST